MFKSWIHDVMEYTEKKMEGRMRDKTHPNYLVGTGGYRKNVMAKMGVKKKKEVKELWQIAPRFDQRKLRENYIKKKVFRMGDIVESLSTGLIGKIIRRGTNYLISVSESNVMFKSWIHDVMEYTEKKMEGRMRDKTHPNYLVGTGGYRKNAQAKVAGQGKIKNFNIEQFINKYKLRK